MITGKRLGDILTESGAVTAEQLGRALVERETRGGRLGRIVVSMGFLSEEELTQILSRQLGAPMAEPELETPSEDLLRLIPESFARKHLLAPIGKPNGAVRVAMADPLDLLARDELAARVSLPLEVSIATEKKILMAIDKTYARPIVCEPGAVSGSFVESGYSGAIESSGWEAEPVSSLVEGIIRRAALEGASDIHLEPDSKNLKVRYRVDGMMKSAGAHPARICSAVASRIKIMAGLDTAESRAPQDGGFNLTLESGLVEFRVSTFPTINGECVVLRLLARSGEAMTLAETGMGGVTLERLLESLKHPWGLVVVTGPTGSGKTTTLYSAISLLNSPERTIVSIEDPVERRIHNVRQTQVNIKSGLTFSRGLRSALRQDPDIIMVGEIRDPETAEVAVQAAMTGHLVLSSLHTVDAASAFTRLTDLGVAPYKVADTVKCAVGQRLARRVCHRCAGKTEAMANCPHCGKTGYRGRTGIFELIHSDEKLKGLILSRSPASAIKDYAVKSQGMDTMRDDGLRKVGYGVTTVAEVERATYTPGLSIC
ncbi:MAG: Flp pilus assembly complex ATPase component TadA [Nitrospinae bacterium]|nr:Flp pilus assembly complex ATPase component TadA [Nitrospinota bacterium]